MNQRLFQLISYLNYWLDAVDAHSLHSPFFYDLYNKHIDPSKRSGGISTIEALRSALLSNHNNVFVEDLGAGSAYHKTSTRKVSDIANVSLSPLKYSMLYRSLVQRSNTRNVVELGTSLGMNALYMALDTNVHLHTFEGSSGIADLANLQFEIARAKNISLIRGNIDQTLPEVLDRIESIDFAFMDANHRFEPTVRYFELLARKAHRGTIIVLDDIHYSEEMDQAWNQLRKANGVYGSVDLFRCGLVFFDPSLNRQHFVLQF